MLYYCDTFWALFRILPKGGITDFSLFLLEFIYNFRYVIEIEEL